MTEGAPAPVPPPPRRRRRWGRWLVGLGGSAVVVVALSGLTGWVWLRSAAGGRSVARLASNAGSTALAEGSLAIGGFSTDGWSHLTLTDVALRDAGGAELLSIGTIDVELRPVDSLWHRRVDVEKVVVDDVRVALDRRSDGRWGLLALLPSNPDAPPSDVLIPVDLDVRQIVATDVVVASGAQSFTGGVDASLRARGGDLSVLGLALAGDVVGPAHGPLALHGRATVGAHDVRLDGLTIVGFPGDLAVSGGVLGYDADTRLDLQVGARPVDLGAVDPLLGAGLKGQWSGVFGVHGPLTALVVQGPLAGAGASRGAADLAVTLDVGSPELSWTAEGDLRDVHLEDLLGTVTKPVVLGGRARVTGRGSRWPEDIVVQGAFDGGPQEAYGYRFSKLAGGFRVEGGVVHLDGLEATHAAVDGVVNGTIDVVNGPMDLDVRGVADLAGLAELGSPGVRGRGPLTVRVRGDVLADVVDVGFTGSLDVAGFAYADDVRAARLVGTFDGRSVGSDVVVDADVTLTDAVSNGLSVARVHEPHVHVERRGDGQLDAVGPRTELEQAVYPSTFAVADGTAAWSVSMAPSGDYDVEAALDLGAHDVLGFPADDGVVELTVDPDRVAFDVWLTDGPRTVARTVGTYGLLDASIALSGLEAAPVPGGVWVADGPVRLRVVEGGAADLDLRLTSDQGSVRIEGDLGTTGVLDGRVAVEGLSLGYLAKLSPSLGDVRGVVDGEWTIAGDAHDAVVVGPFDAKVVLPDRPAVRLVGDVETGGGGARLHLGVDQGGRLLTVAGRMPVVTDLAAPRLDRAGAVDLDLQLAARPIASWAALAGSTAPGRLSGRITIDGTLGDPDVDGLVVVDVPVAGLERPSRAEVSLSRVEGALELHADVFDGLNPVAHVDGTALSDVDEAIAWALGEPGASPDFSDWDAFLRDLSVDVGLVDVPARSLAALAGYEDAVGGRVRGDFAIRGSPRHPTANGSVAWSNGRIGDAAVTGATVRVAPTAGGYDVVARLDFEQAGGLAVSGTVETPPDLARLDDAGSGRIDLVVSGTDLPLAAAAAFLPGASRVQGRVDAQGTVVGTLGAPKPALSLAVRDGEMVYEPVGLRVSALAASVTADEAGVTLESMVADTAPSERVFGLAELAEEQSRIEGSGTLALVDWTPGDVEGQVTLNRAWILAQNDLQIRSSGALAVRGAWPEAVVSGDLGIDSALVVQDLASFLTTGPLQIDPRITVHRGEVAVASQSEVAPSVLDDVTFDVSVDLSRNLEIQVAFPFIDDLGLLGASVTRADVAARLGGDVRYRVADGVATMKGGVEVVEGTVRVLQTTFDLGSGTATFQGDPFDPLLDLRATSDVGGATVDLGVAGTALQPAIDLSSDDYPDQSQVMTLLLTGRPPDALTADQGTAATQALLGLLLSSVLSGTRLGSLSFEPDGSMRIGVPVGKDVFAETRFSPNPDVDENPIAVDVEWQLAPKLVLDVAWGTRESWLDLYWEARF